MNTPDTAGRPEHLGPMARSLIQTFAELTLRQQQRVFVLLREILETNEQAAALGQAETVSETRSEVDGR